MAGGKETPRQKMIGMMYLVLTALLALNVSKSILDAFVAIEENMQEANLTELFRGNEKRSEIVETSIDNSNPQRALKAKLYLETIKDIDEMTAKRIHLIDQLKIQLLTDCGEDVSTVGGKTSILMGKFNSKSPQIKPIRMNLENVEGKDKYDEAMHLFIGEDIKKPVGKGIELWNSYLNFRKELTEKVASSQLKIDKNGKAYVDKAYYFKAPMIKQFKDQKDLNEQLQKALKSSNVHNDDETVLLDIYSSLSKNEYSTVHDITNVHWIGKTFDHAPSVAAIASLSSLQKDILSARAKAIILIRNRMGVGEYSFNKIIPLAYGPEVVNANEEFTLEVLMAAFDSDKQPEVIYNGANVSDVHDGKGYLKLQAQGSTMDLNGTISIRNKSGIKKTMEWNKTVHVMKPSGSIEIPGYNLLYRTYDNIVDPTASGFPKTVLTGSGVSITKSNGMYVVRPTGNSKEATLIVSGKTKDGKIVQLKRVNYKVSNLPKPTLYWGGSAPGEPGSIHNTSLIAKYGPEIPLNVKFDILSWEVQISGAAPQKGTGNSIASLKNFLKAAPKGSSVNIYTRVQTPQKLVLNVSGAYRL
jgi:gliding motility-associated protein GldM